MWSAGCPADPGVGGSPAGQNPEEAQSVCSCSSPPLPGESRCRSCPESIHFKKLNNFETSGHMTDETGVE